MNCHDLRACLMEILDGRLAPGAATVARAHLDSCSDCRREADLHRRTWDLVGRIGGVEPGPAFGALVRRRVRRSKVAALIGACAAAAAVIAVLVLAPWKAPAAPAGEDLALRRLNPEDRRLLEELSSDGTWELAENIELL